MNKNKQTLLIFLSILIIMVGLVTFDGVLFANKRLRIQNIQLEDEKITTNLKNFKIAYVSDIHYNLYVDDTRFEKVINTLKEANPDLIVFGGDIIHDLDSKQLDPDQMAFLIEQFKSLKPPYGAFAISGDQEVISEYASKTMSTLYQMGDIEMIDNKALKIYYQDDYFNLVGMGPTLTEGVDVLSGIDETKPTIVLSHKPSNADLVNKQKIDLFVAGFTHGGQINIPGFNNVFYDGQPYIKRFSTVDGMDMAISNGAGVDKIDMRMFSDGDILLITLKQK